MYGDLVVKTNKTVILPQSNIEICQMIADDLTREQIAEKLGVKKRSVDDKFHIMKKKLGCQTIMGVIGILFRKGLLKTLLLFPLALNAQTRIIEKDLDTVIVASSCVLTVKKYVPVGLNKPPVAVFVGEDTAYSTSDSTVNFVLDASRSYDPEGWTLRFYWRQTKGTTVTILNSTKSIATAMKLGVGIYDFEVRVVDPMNAFVAKKWVVQVTSAR